MSKYWRKKLKHRVALVWLEMRERGDELIHEIDRGISHMPLFRSIKRLIMKKKKTGFTLIELLIVLVLIGVASTGGLMAWQGSQQKARDATRKTDLTKIQTAFEDYYNDNRCYPSEPVLQNCGSDSLSPYLKTVPCDPFTDDPYLYVPLDNQCRGYRLYAQLENDLDPAISQLGCDTEVGCGWGEAYNYGVSSGTTVFDPNGDSSITASPTPSGIYSGDFACAPGLGGGVGQCNLYANPADANCPVSFGSDSTCNSACANQSNWCDW